MPDYPSLAERLAVLYPSLDAAGRESFSNKVLELAATVEVSDTRPLLSERDIVLITYADQIRGDKESPLATLAGWLSDTRLAELFGIVHLLPFCPWSSDDGFAVIDYLEVDKQAGTWEDIAKLGEQVDLMFDLVLNHLSAESDWFRRYKQGEAPFTRYFIEVDGEFDTSQVVRPRSSPLVTSLMTTRGTREVWTTFSDDQIDLNYAEPDLMLAMLGVLLEYAKRGARIIRLDAIAYLWKQSGTTCIHLPETHEAIKLMRDVVSAAYPGTLLLTETNVPHAENVAYFGDGNEAHMVYQFSLPPLLVDAMVHGDAVWLKKWLTELAPPPSGCTYFNFTASHDGIGVRPLEGLVPDERFATFVDAMRDRGGLIGTRRMADGTDVPYELNISYVNAVSPTATTRKSDAELHARRFLTTQAVMLALQGVPAAYIHSVVGSQNDEAGAKETGINRRINRRKFDRQGIDAQVADITSLSGMIYTGYKQMLAVRREVTAFHPEAAQALVADTPDQVLAFTRTSVDGKQEVLVLANFGDEPVSVAAGEMFAKKPKKLRDLLGNVEPSKDARVEIPAGGCAWLLAE